MGRAAQGVRILSIDKPDFVIGLDRIVKEDEAAAAVDEAPAAAVEEAPGTVEAPESSAE